MLLPALYIGPQQHDAENSHNRTPKHIISSLSLEGKKTIQKDNWNKIL